MNFYSEHKLSIGINTIFRFSRALICLRAVWFALFLALSVSGCASGQAGSVVEHGFEFNAVTDSPGIQVLAYSYGDSPNTYGGRLRATVEDTKNGTTFQAANITGPMVVGRYFHVKWRIKKTGEVVEDTVDLQKQWPRSMEDQQINFMIEDHQLYVYFITLLNLRPYFNPEDRYEMKRFSNTSPRTKALEVYAINYVALVYPYYQLDPHLPPALRRK